MTAETSLSPKSVAALELWRRKLLDLSKRNRALAFRPTRVSTVAVVDEIPGEVFRTLWMRRGTMGFQPARERPAAPEPNRVAQDAVAQDGVAPNGVAPNDVAQDGEAEFAPAQDFAPYDPSTLAGRHSDALLQTAHPEQHLDRALLRLGELAKSSLEEQGVNTLFLALGMLHHRDASEPNEALRAPLVLLPVALERASARTGFKLRASGEDPLVNPALVEYLRRTRGIELPTLPLEGLPEDFELQSLLARIKDSIRACAGWSLADEVWLAIFSFQKFVMYKDLEAHGQRFAAHRPIKQLVERRVEQLAGLPQEVRELDLDRDFAPERTAQVVDADSSQLRAIAAVARGHDLVLAGPPGTGKSQTITNLIAHALANGKSVLFVAEKMAALQVVHARLSAAGLGEFCLELHSSKANKRAVIEDIKRALDASLQAPQTSEDARRSLPTAREALNGYVRALHQPFGALARSPYEICGEFVRVADAPRLALEIEAASVDAEALEAAVRAIRELVRTLEDVGDPAQHPWRDATRDYYAPSDLAAIEAACGEARQRLVALDVRARAVSAAFGLPHARSWSEFDRIRRAAGVIARSPGAPTAVLQSSEWNSAPPAAEAQLQLLERFRGLRARILQRFDPSVLESDPSDDIAYVEQKSSGLSSLFAFLDARYRAIRKRWTECRATGYAPSMAEQAQAMRDVVACRSARAELQTSRERALAMFGELWKGESSDPIELRAYVAWVVEFRREFAACPLEARACEVASRPSPDLSEVFALLELAGAARKSWEELARRVGWPVEYLADARHETLRERLERLGTSIAKGPAWAAYAGAVARSRSSLAARAVELACAGGARFEQLERGFLRAVFERFLEAAVAERVELRQFHSLTHEQRVDEFQRLDRRVLEENRKILVAELRLLAQRKLQTPEAEAGKAFLLGQMNRQRAHAPLRRTMQQAEATIRAIKPCFLMSPLTAAQLLRADEPSFDLVVFDEASQLPAEDAIGSIARGRQLVVVGDPKQLPPTDFFRVIGDPTDVALDEDGEPIIQDGESVLEEFSSSGAPCASLQWHYRSAHEALIEFSNTSFYRSELRTFPGVERSPRTGLDFVHVSSGVYEGGGYNPEEVRAVSEAVVRHARENPGESLGVGTFSLRQQLAIQDELERRRREDPALESFFAAAGPEAFFVKNLENIQGDERDAIFLSVTYGKARDGRLRCNFGPLNGRNGWRRLNVLVTRARRHMRVFASIRGDDIGAAASASPGPRLMKDFLNYAESGTLAGARAADSAAETTALERDVRSELERRGLELRTQIGASGHRIDFAVLDAATPERFTCGIECDGRAYGASQTARDRDRLRQQVLEARGWTIHRIWSTDWFKDRAGQIERILRRVEESKRAAREAAEARAQRPVEPPAPPAPPAEAAEDETLAGELERSPKLVPYRVCAMRAQDGELVDASAARIAKLMRTVVAGESPIHVDDLFARVLAAYGKSRLGARIQGRLEEALAELLQSGGARLRERFVWSREDTVVPRDRTGMRIPAERISGEEYEAALRAVLETRALERKDLVKQVCAALGVGRTEAARERIETALDELVAAGTIGEGSSGYVLRA